MRRDPRVFPVPSLDPRRLSGVKASWSYRCAVAERNRKGSQLRELENILTRHQREESIFRQGEELLPPRFIQAYE